MEIAEINIVVCVPCGLGGSGGMGLAFFFVRGKGWEGGNGGFSFSTALMRRLKAVLTFGWGFLLVGLGI